jgi:hypothetical protein
MRPSLRQVLFRSAAGLDLNFAGGVFNLNNTRTSNPANIPGWSFSRTDTNGTATALDLAGNVIQFATGAPRITNRGILVEEARTNLLLNSAWAGVSSGAPTSWTVLLNGGGVAATSTIGSPNAMTFTASANRPSIFQDVAVAANTTYSASLFVEANPNGLDAFQMLTLVGAPVGSTVTGATGVPVAGQRITATVAVGGTSGTVTMRAGAGVSSSSTGTVRLSLPQLELGAFATSPIITTGAAGTRGADAPRVTVVGGEKTVIVEGIAPTTLTATLRCLASLTTADFATYVVAGFTSTGTVQLFRKSSLGNTTLGVTSNVVTAGAPFKFAFTFGTDGTDASCLNGGTPVTNTGLAGVYTFTELRPGWWAGDPGPFNAYDGRIRVFDRRVTAAELQALTAP